MWLMNKWKKIMTSLTKSAVTFEDFVHPGRNVITTDLLNIGEICNHQGQTRTEMRVITQKRSNLYQWLGRFVVDGLKIT
jgi:hypothetical protein